ncbi:hypothetical protein D3C87_1882120 [compost metagenome]
MTSTRGLPDVGKEATFASVPSGFATMFLSASLANVKATALPIGRNGLSVMIMSLCRRATEAMLRALLTPQARAMRRSGTIAARFQPTLEKNLRCSILTQQTRSAGIRPKIDMCSR